MRDFFRHNWPLALIFCARFFVQTGLASPTVLLNEVLASNLTGLHDENGDTPDWIELHNPGDQFVDLKGWALSDEPKHPFKWQFQTGTVKPGGFLVVFASGKDRQPGNSPTLSPASVSGLVLWLNASTINTNDNFQVRKNSNGIFVRRWMDTSGNQNHASAANDSNQPLWIDDSTLRNPVLRFDGINAQLLLARVLATNQFTLIVVARATRIHETEPESTAGVGGTSGQRYLFGATHGGDFNAGSGISMGTNGVAVYEHGSGYMPPLASYSGPLGDSFHVLSVRYNNKRPNLSIDGLVAREGLTSPRDQVTAPVEIGAGNYGAFAGDIAEILIYNRALTEAEQSGIEQNLSSRYSIELPRPLHTNFQLSSSGEELSLTSPDGTQKHVLKFGAQFRDVSFGLQPDGTGEPLFFNTPTPGSSNTFPGAIEFLEPPVFSAPAGFYTTNFNLTLRSPDPSAEIRYTLDGSEPTLASPRYGSALIIRSRNGSGNQLSNIPTVPGGPVANGEVFKGWVVRARAFKDRALPSQVATHSYWVDPKGRRRYTVPVVSIATDRRHFFSPETGIYVPGSNLNYNQRGVEWERPIHVELCELDNSVPISQPADAKIHGNTSQNFPIKGLDLDATGLRGGKPFKYPFFPDRQRKEYEHVLLRPTGHDQQMTFMRDEFMQSLGAETGAESQAARLCVVFIDGEYWGLHYLKEKEDTDFIAYWSALSASELDYLESYAVAKAGDTTHYDEMIQYISSHDLQAQGVYESIGTRMEIPNYIDYKACEIFFYRWDIGNHRLWRPRTPEGRWRWLQFDNDVGWGGFWALQPAWNYNMLEADLSTDGRLNGHNNEVTTFLLRQLIQHPTFRKDFINRFCDLMNTTLHPSNTTNRIDFFAHQLEPEMAEHIQRWLAPASVAEWKSQLQTSRAFGFNRPNAVRQHLQSRFGLGSPTTLKASVSNPNAGSLQINSLIRHDSPDAPFTGIYFKNHPLLLRAVPQPGFQFTGWLGLNGETNAEQTVSLDGPLQVQAQFTPIETIPLTFQLEFREGLQKVKLHGPSKQPVQIERSEDLIHWTTAQSVQLDADGTIQLSPPTPAPAASVFLRAVIQ